MHNITVINKHKLMGSLVALRATESVRNLTGLNIHTGHVKPCVTVITTNPVLTVLVFSFFHIFTITYSTVVRIRVA